MKKLQVKTKKAKAKNSQSELAALFSDRVSKVIMKNMAVFEKKIRRAVMKELKGK